MPDPIAAVAEATGSAENESAKRKEIFIKNWAKMVGLPPTADVFDIVVELINKSKNFQTATCLLFGLSYRTHKDWIVKCSTYWRDGWTEGSICTKEWLITFQKFYITDPEGQPYPEDG